MKWLHDDHITDKAHPAALAPFKDDAPLAPPQEYTIRRMRPDEAIQVSQLMYRAYGNTYFNEDVYYPDRVAAHNAAGSVLSFVAVGADGQLAGHYALERDEEGPVAEGGQAVVDPAHRGRGLLDRMKDAALAEAKRMNLVGVFADAVTVHTMTQQSDIKHGAHLTCADLAIAPRTEKFHNISTDLPQRLSCLLFFQWLEPPTPRTIYVPERHRAIVTKIYDNLECPVEFGTPAAATGHGTLTVNIDSGAACAFIRADELGADTAQLIRHAKREVIERSHAEAVYVDLPLADPGNARDRRQNWKPPASASSASPPAFHSAATSCGWPTSSNRWPATRSKPPTPSPANSSTTRSPNKPACRRAANANRCSVLSVASPTKWDNSVWHTRFFVFCRAPISRRRC